MATWVHGAFDSVRRLALSLCLLLSAAGTARAAPGDCKPHALTPKPANLVSLIREHGKWLATRDGKAPKGSRADLSYVDLSGVSWVGFDLREINLTGSKLQGAKLDGARLELAQLGCALADGAAFSGANLFQATLTDASMIGSTLTGAKLGGADLTGADLASADFSNADLRQAKLVSATMRNTHLKDAKFTEVDVKDAVWQPLDEPDATTMALVDHLSTLKLDQNSPDPGGLTRLVGALRDAGLEDRAKEAAHARERAVTGLNWSKWERESDVVSLAWACFRETAGWLTDYGLSLTRGLKALIVWCLLFVPFYFLWGFSAAPGRQTGISKIRRAKTLVPGPAGEKLTAEDEVEPLAPATWPGRLFWALCFSGVTTVRSGIGPFNVLEALERLFGWKVMDVTGWLRRVANAQSFISALLIACLVYAYFL